MSRNYEARNSEGWVDGRAKYASEEPHHDRHGNYTIMSHAERERTLTLIIEGEHEGVLAPTGLKAKITLIETFPVVSDDPEKDYEYATSATQVQSFLRRSIGGFDEDVPLMDGKDGYGIFTDGWDEVSKRDGEWTSVSYDASIERA